MKRSVCILCRIVLLISYSAIKTVDNSEIIASENTVRVFGSVTDSTNTAIPNASVKFISSDVTISTLSDLSGMYSVLLPNNPTSVESSTPESFTLFQNYPNPFNPSTLIQYSLDEPSSVSLDIYSITGQHVRSLANGNESPGMHRVVWDGRDEAGSNVAAGVYLYRLRSGREIQTKKMVLLDGAASNSSFSGKISAHAVKKSADYDSDKEYTVVAEKSTMNPYWDTVLISDDQSEIEKNIVFQDTYFPYRLFFKSENYKNFFIHPGDSLGVYLAGVHEKDLPDECQVTLTSGKGDSETITVSGSSNYMAYITNCRSDYYRDCRSGSLASSTESPVHNNGVIEVNAHADTVFAASTLLTGETITNKIAVIDSLDSIVAWGRTYVHWGNDWFIVGELGWDRTSKISINITFEESTTENEISEFILNNNLQVGHKFTEYKYWFKLNNSIHPVEFVLELEGNIIIKDAYAGLLACVA